MISLHQWHYCQPLYVRFPLAVVICITAFFLRYTLWPLNTHLTYITFWPAAVIGFILCGFGPGSFIVVLMALAGNYVFMPPAFDFSLGGQSILVMGIFIVANLGSGLLIRQIHLETIKSRQQSDQVQAVLDTVIDAVITINSQGMIQSFNKAAERLFGYEEKEIVGRNVNILMPAPYHSEHDGYISNYLKTGQAKVIGTAGLEAPALHKDGTTFPMEFSITESIAIGGGRLFTGIARDITQRKASEERLIESEKTLRTMLENAPIALRIIQNKSNKIVFANPAYAAMYQCSLDHLVGSSPEMLYQNPQDFHELLKRVEWGEYIFNQKVSLKTLHGEPVFALGSFLPITYEQMACKIAWFYDITPIILAKEKAQIASKAKSEFLSSMSHELRTPLNAILGFADLLEMDAKLDAESKGCATLITNAGKHLLHLVNDIIDLASIEAGKLEISLEGIAFVDVIQESFHLVSEMAAHQGIKLVNASQCSGSMGVKADYSRLRQVLVNFLSNAIKYNRPNGRVTVACEKRDDKIRISIADTGEGIPKESQHRLFQSSFDRLGFEKSAIEGTGIGLVITKRLVEAMNGMVGFESTEGEGSTFWVELPMVHIVDEPKKESLSSIVLPDAPLPTHVLVAEDNPANQKLIQAFLRKLGYEDVVIVDNGEKAKLAIEKGRYDLCLMDCQMPVMDGYTASVAIRKIEQDTGNHIPIIAMTANAMEGDQEKCLAAGMDDYISKPIAIQKLAEVLGKWQNNPSKPATFMGGD